MSCGHAPSMLLEESCTTQSGPTWSLYLLVPPWLLLYHPCDASLPWIRFASQWIFSVQPVVYLLDPVPLGPCQFRVCWNCSECSFTEQIFRLHNQKILIQGGLQKTSAFLTTALADCFAGDLGQGTTLDQKLPYTIQQEEKLHSRNFPGRGGGGNQMKHYSISNILENSSRFLLSVYFIHVTSLLKITPFLLRISSAIFAMIQGSFAEESAPKHTHTGIASSLRSRSRYLLITHP